MRRDYFTIDIRPEPGDDGIPSIAIEYTGPAGGLRDRLTETAEATLDSSELDVAFRHQAETDGGVLSLTDRMTVVVASTEHNTLLPADGLEKIVSQFDGTEKAEQGLHGGFAAAEGLVYSKFSRTEHVKPA